MANSEIIQNVQSVIATSKAENKIPYPKMGL